MFVGLVLLAGCQSQQPTNVRHVSFGIFEVVDCKTSGMAPKSLQGSTEKYCLSAKPIVDETDVRTAQALRSDSGKARLELFFTLKTGEHVKEVTGRINAEHLRRNEQGSLGIVIDGTLVTVATLSGVISDTFVVDGSFGWEEAVQIAQSLNHVR
jgi:preprotein translocase subunit SecD